MPRKKIDDAGLARNRSVKIPDEMWSKWQEYAKKYGLNVSEFVRIAAETCCDVDIVKHSAKAIASGTTLTEYVSQRLE